MDGRGTLTSIVCLMFRIVRIFECGYEIVWKEALFTRSGPNRRRKDFIAKNVLEEGDSPWTLL